MSPAPRPSPRPDVAPELADEPKTGEYPASRDFVREVRDSGLFRVAWWIGGAAVVLFVAGAMATRAVAQEAHDAGVQAAQGHETRLQAVEQQVPQLRQEVFETRGELRELYKAVVDHKRSEKLEHPAPKPQFPDGGAP